MPVAVDLAVDLLEEGEAFGGQRQQRRALDLGEHLADLLAGRAMDAGVGHRGLPVQQIPVLVGQTGELPTLEPVCLDEFDSGFRLPLVSRSTRPRRQQGRAVMLAERLDLGVELRVEPVDLEDGGLQVVRVMCPVLLCGGTGLFAAGCHRSRARSGSSAT
jgi:hypothetical protein